MRVRVLFFGITKEIVGNREMNLEIPDRCSVADFKTYMQDRFPELSDLSAVAIAVGGNYANDSTLIASGNEIALIPPVSGG